MVTVAEQFAAKYMAYLSLVATSGLARDRLLANQAGHPQYNQWVNQYDLYRTHHTALEQEIDGLYRRLQQKYTVTDDDKIRSIVLKPVDRLYRDVIHQKFVDMTQINRYLDTDYAEGRQKYGFFIESAYTVFQSIVAYGRKTLIAPIPATPDEPWWQGYRTERRSSFMQAVERVSGVRLNRR